MIKLADADGKRLDNVQSGQSPQHNYYNRQYYLSKVETIWEKLRQQKVVSKSFKYLKNLNHFKYSPYTMLTEEQYNICIEILNIVLEINKIKEIEETGNIVLVEGGAGTGKTVMASYIFNLLKNNNDKNFIEEQNYEAYDNIDDFEEYSEINKICKKIKEIYKCNKNYNVAFVIQKVAFRETMLNLVSNYLNISKQKASEYVLSPSTIAISEKKYDILIVDEAHRLKRAKNMQEMAAVYVGNGYGKTINDKNPTPAEIVKSKIKNEQERENLNFLTALKRKSKYLILFYDSNQRVHTSDISKKNFDKETIISIGRYKLQTQLRTEGGDKWDNFVENIFINNKEEKINFEDYDVRIFDNPNDMFNLIKIKEKECKENQTDKNESGLCRVVAGYAWKWKSKKDKTKYDIEIGNDFKKQWNIKTKDWPISPETIEEIGSRDTIQGYDLNYCGVIIGPDIFYKDGKIQIDNNYIFDNTLKKGNLTQEEINECIINTYKMMLKRGIKGCYIYVCDEELRKYFKNSLKQNG